MSDQPPRRLNLEDMMIVIAVSGVTLALAMALQAGRPSRFPGLPVSWLVAVTASPFLLGFAVAFVALRVRQPRPPVRRLLRQPGTLACLVVVVDTVVRLVFLFGSTALRPVFRTGAGGTYAMTMYVSGTTYAGGDIALVWTLLALLRLWRPARDGFDRAGRVFGWIMIALWVVLSLSF